MEEKTLIQIAEEQNVKAYEENKIKRLRELLIKKLSIEKQIEEIDKEKFGDRIAEFY